MKKIMILVICLLLVLSLAACGGQDVSADTAAPATESQPVEQTPAPTTEAPTEETVPETQPAFDNSWSANDYEKLIPQPPFEGWTGKQTGSKVYEMETSQANADGSGTYYDTFGAYAQTLKDCGFAMEGDTYQWEGADQEGNRVELKCGDGFAWITIISAEPYTVETAAPADVGLFDSSWTENPFEKLIPQPPFEDWTGSVMAPNVYVLSCAYGNEEDWGIYKQTLLDAGFSLEDVDRGYKGFDAMGNYFEFMCTENQAMIVNESVEALGE